MSNTISQRPLPAQALAETPPPPNPKDLDLSEVVIFKYEVRQLLPFEPIKFNIPLLFRSRP